MLISTFTISNAGFGRWLSNFSAPLFGDFYWKHTNFTDGLWPYIGFQLLRPLPLILALGVYDFITPKRLHPAYGWALIFYLSVNLFTGWLYFSQAWRTLAIRIVR